MKKLVLLIPCLLALCCSCNSDERAINKVAKGYLNAMANYQIADAYQYATEETCNTTLSFVENDIMPHLAPNIISDNTPATITIDSLELSNDTTALVFYSKTTPLGDMSDQITLHKRGSKWKVHLVIAASPITGLFHSANSKAQTQAIDSTRQEGYRQIDSLKRLYNRTGRKIIE